MKKLLLSSAILAASGFAAVGQDAPAEMFRAAADPLEVQASQFIGMRIYASEAVVDADEYAGVQPDWQDIGEINDVIISRSGTVDAVLVDIGGFLGMGERQVAVDMSAIKFVADGNTADQENDYFLVMNAPRAQLEGAPEYSMNAAPMDGAAVDDTATTTQDAPAEDMAATEAAPATDTAATDAAPATDTAATDAAVADAATDPDNTMGATDETMMADPMVREGYTSAMPADLTAEMLTGAKVYDTTDGAIGEVGELILADDGQISEVIIDVGGFLGMGEKPVALKLDQIEILRQDGGTEVRVYVPMTKEQMKALPDYKA